MGTSRESFDQVKDILRKLDSSITEARRKREVTDDEAAANAEPSLEDTTIGGPPTPPPANTGNPSPQQPLRAKPLRARPLNAPKNDFRTSDNNTPAPPKPFGG